MEAADTRDVVLSLEKGNWNWNFILSVSVTQSQLSLLSIEKKIAIKKKLLWLTLRSGAFIIHVAPTSSSSLHLAVAVVTANDFIFKYAISVNFYLSKICYNCYYQKY